MGGLAEEQRAQLARWREQYRGDPAAELRRLLLLALEREQLVAIAYRDDALASRLAELDVPDEVRLAFGQALAWAWRDEQQHTVFTRGLLRSSPRRSLRALAWVQVTMGAVAGWASSTQHHATWRRAPLARALAGAVTGAGYVAGKVPRAMRRRLRHLGFAEYCRLQREAEVSAAACWERMASIARALPGFDAATADAFHRMWQDEERHRRAFETLADAIDEDGAFRSEHDPVAVVDALRGIGPMFVPRERRRGTWGEHPLGRGGRVVMHQGGADDDPAKALHTAIETAGLADVLEARAHARGVSLDALRVVIKPTFMLAYHRRDRAVHTDPELVHALVDWLGQRGVTRIAIAEAPTLYDRLFEGRSVTEVARYVGLDRDDYELVDLDAKLAPHDYPAGLGPTSISTAWRDADVRIAFPKLRSHPVDFAHLSLGGLEGIAGRIESYLFSERRAERETATMMPLVEYPPHFAIVDGWRSAADGLVGMIACADPPTPYRLWTGRDALAVDIVTMRHLGLADPRDCDLLATAMTWFGDPRPHTEVAGADTPVAGWRHPYATGMSALLALLAAPAFQYAGERGSVFAPPMDPTAFVARAPAGAWLRLRRAVMRRLLRIRAPALPPST